ncbi:hypothetical protein [Chlorella virus XW01]|nr:hypothetical protein [Chlorella virus XW01]
MKFDLFNIIVIIFMIYVIYRLPSVEKMTNIDKATEEKIREIYKIDTDAIRNLSNLARDLTVDGKLKVPGGLDVIDKVKLGPSGWDRHLILGGKNREAVNGEEAHIHSTNGNLHLDSQNGHDIYLNHYTKRPVRIDGTTYINGLLKVNRTDEHPWNHGWGNGVHTWDMKVDASADINNLSVRNSVNVANDLVFNGKNNWIFHTPNDGRHVVYISPSTAQGNTTWDWGKGLELHPNGKVLIKGDLEVQGQLHVHGRGLFANNNVEITNNPWSSPYFKGGHILLKGDHPNYGKQAGIQIGAYYGDRHGSLWRYNHNGSFHQEVRY